MECQWTCHGPGFVQKRPAPLLQEEDVEGIPDADDEAPQTPDDEPQTPDDENDDLQDPQHPRDLPQDLNEHTNQTCRSQQEEHDAECPHAPCFHQVCVCVCATPGPRRRASLSLDAKSLWTMTDGDDDFDDMDFARWRY